MQITTIGLDLAKQVFRVHGVDARGHTVLTKQVRREQMHSFFANLPPCRIGMEACASAHYWGRELTRLGHDVRLMAPQFVKPYVKSNKNDAADAQAICEAVGRPTMRYVALKSVEQQAVLSAHRARDGLVRARGALANQIRGLLAEFGLVMPVGVSALRHQTPALLDDARDRLPLPFVHLIEELLAHMDEQDRHLQVFERQIVQWHRSNPSSLRLAQIPGVGPITASALVATDGRLARTGAQAALKRWQADVAGNQQPGRWLPAQAAATGGAFCSVANPQDWRWAVLGGSTADATTRECRGDRSG